MAKEISELKAEIARLKQPRTTSQNSSQPPSRDFKSSIEKKHKRSKKKGAKPGHEKQERQLVENPNKVIEVYADHCENCDHNLLDQVPERVIRRQTTELPEIKPVVLETRHYEVICPCCGEVQRGKLPEGLEGGRYFGPRLEALVTDLHHEHHVGFKRLLKICEEIFGLILSAGGAVSIVERAGKAAQAEAEVIGERVRQGKVIGSEKTSARMHGKNWWQWVFLGEDCEYHRIEPSRGYDMVEEFMWLQGIGTLLQERDEIQYLALFFKGQGALNCFSICFKRVMATSKSCPIINPFPSHRGRRPLICISTCLLSPPP